jgi:hypothetical protein
MIIKDEGAHIYLRTRLRIGMRGSRREPVAPDIAARRNPAVPGQSKVYP